MIRSLSVSRNYAPLRVCADMCFYFFALSVMSLSVRLTSSDGTTVYGVVNNLVAPWELQLAVLSGACLALGFVIVHVESAALRFILSLVPGLSFLMSPFDPIMLIHAAAWVYFVIFMTVGNFEVYIDVYRRRCRVMLLVAFLLACGVIFFHFSADSWNKNKLFGGEIFGLLFFAFSVLSLRGMRLSLGAPKMMRAMDSAFVIALPAVIMAVFFLLRSAVPVLTAFFSLVMRFLRWLYGLFFPEKEIPDILYIVEELEEKAANEDKQLRPVDKDDLPVTEPISGRDPRLHVSARAWFFIAIILLIAFLVMITIRLMRSKHTEFEKPKIARERFEKIPFEGLLRRRSSEPAMPANVKQIRKVYRSYLDHIRELHRKIAPSDTSEDVLSLSSEFYDIPENRKLRELYIAARYGDPASVTSEQVSEAKRCLSVIESAKPRIAEQNS